MWAAVIVISVFIYKARNPSVATTPNLASCGGSGWTGMEENFYFFPSLLRSFLFFYHTELSTIMTPVILECTVMLHFLVMLLFLYLYAFLTIIWDYCACYFLHNTYTRRSFHYSLVVIINAVEGRGVPCDVQCCIGYWVCCNLMCVLWEWLAGDCCKQEIK